MAALAEQRFERLDLDLAAVRELADLCGPAGPIVLDGHPLRNEPDAFEGVNFEATLDWRPLLAYGLARIALLARPIVDPDGTVYRWAIVATPAGAEWLTAGCPPIRPPASAMTPRQCRAARAMAGRRAA